MKPRSSSIRTVLAHAARLALVSAAAVVAAASASSQNQPPAVASPTTQAPPPQPMEPAVALGLWKSSFGAVKIETDATAAGRVHGVWVYDRQGEEVVGYFGGGLNGNVLQFTWQEPGPGGAPGLAGEGYLVFDPYGQRFTGRWWTTARDRMGEWTGWRQGAGLDPDPYGADPYGGAGYGDPYGGATYGDPYEPPPPPPAY